MDATTWVIIVFVFGGLGAVGWSQLRSMQRDIQEIEEDEDDDQQRRVEEFFADSRTGTRSAPSIEEQSVEKNPPDEHAAPPERDGGAARERSTFRQRVARALHDEEVQGEYRYPNLALAANTYRFVGGVQTVFGVLFCATGLLTGPFKNAPELAGAPPWMPLAVAIFGPMLGLWLVVRGVSQAAHGEALLALGDIAVATVSRSRAARPIQVRRSMLRFELTVAALVVVVVLGFSVALGVTRDIAAGRTVRAAESALPVPPKRSVPPDLSRPPGRPAGVAPALPRPSP